jgi:peptidoglycan/xylan/chitin deacetylase (PgdA/CDA1 family)
MDEVRRRNALLQAALQLPRSPRLTVLIFHRVLTEFDPLRPSEPTASEFEERMRWIAANFVVLPLAAAAAALQEDRLPRRALCITFDDGYADNHDVALPILRRVGLPATFFIATGYLDGGCMFNDAVIEAVRHAQGPVLELEELGFGRHRVGNDQERRQVIGHILERLKYLEPAQREDVARSIVERAGGGVPAQLMMSTEQVAALHRAHMDIGAHTVTHPILARIGLDAAREEIARGRERLQEIIGGKVQVFAYPNGRPLHDYRREHVALARELGFDAAVSTAWGAARAGDDLFQIPRFTPWDRPHWRFGLRLAKNLLGTQVVRA